MKIISVIMKATEGCNLRCAYCYNSESEYGKEVLPKELLRKFLELLANTYDRVSIVWHGGEPLLVGMDYMLFAVQKEEELFLKTGTVFRNSIQTNATMINNEWICFFKKYRFKVGVSFDGVSNSNYRQQSEKVRSSIALLQKKKLQFGCLAVVADDQYDMIKNYLFFRSLNVSFDLSPMFCEGGGGKLSPLTSEIFSEKLIALFDEWLYDTNGVNIRVFSDYIGMMFGRNTRTCTHGSCHGKWLGIVPNGNLYNCGRDGMKHYPFGNVKDMSNISEAFKSDGFRELLVGAIERRNKCKASCPYFQYCESGCSDCAMIENGLENIPTFSCDVFKRVFPYVRDKVQNVVEQHVPLTKLNPYFRKALIHCMTE